MLESDSPKHRKFKDPRIQMSTKQPENPKIPESKNSSIQEFRNPRIYESKSIRIPKFNNLNTQQSKNPWIRKNRETKGSRIKKSK